MGWSIIEPGMYLLAACLLTLRPILRKLSPKELGPKLRNYRVFRKAYGSKSDDSQELSRQAQPPGSSASGLVELQDRSSKSSVTADRNMPFVPSSTEAVSPQFYDVEQGFAAPMRPEKTAK